MHNIVLLRVNKAAMATLLRHVGRATLFIAVVTKQGKDNNSDRITLPHSETTSTVCLEGQDIRNHNTMRQWAMCLCIHEDIKPLLSLYMKEKRSITVYKQLSSHM